MPTPVLLLLSPSVGVCLVLGDALDVYQYKKHRGGSMRVTILPQAIILTKACWAMVSMMAKGCIASEVFLIFTTQLYSCLCNYNSIVFISWQEESIATEIFPIPNTSLSSLLLGSKNSYLYRHMYRSDVFIELLYILGSFQLTSWSTVLPNHMSCPSTRLLLIVWCIGKSNFICKPLFYPSTRNSLRHLVAS